MEGGGGEGAGGGPVRVVGLQQCEQFHSTHPKPSMLDPSLIKQRGGRDGRLTGGLRQQGAAPGTAC